MRRSGVPSTSWTKFLAEISHESKWETMNPEYAQNYARLYHHHWWWRSREAFLVSELRRLFPRDSNAALQGCQRRILDVGCGDGLFFSRLREFGQPEGVEADASLITEAGSRWGPIHVGHLATYQPEHRFDVIIAADVMEHVDDDTDFLVRLSGLLAEGGGILVTVPAFPQLWTQHDEWNLHRRRYTRGSLAAVAKSAGLRVIDDKYFFSWLVIPKLIVRWLERGQTGLHRRPDIPPIPLNFLAEVLSRGEQLLASVVPAPAGTSLYAWLKPERPSASIRN